MSWKEACIGRQMAFLLSSSPKASAKVILVSQKLIPAFKTKGENHGLSSVSCRPKLAHWILSHMQIIPSPGIRNTIKCISLNTLELYSHLIWLWGGVGLPELLTGEGMLLLIHKPDKVTWTSLNISKRQQMNGTFKYSLVWSISKQTIVFSWYNVSFSNNFQ